jgi:hypothetical protein
MRRTPTAAARWSGERSVWCRRTTSSTGRRVRPRTRESPPDDGDPGAVRATTTPADDAAAQRNSSDRRDYERERAGHRDAPEVRSTLSPSWVSSCPNASITNEAGTWPAVCCTNARVYFARGRSRFDAVQALRRAHLPHQRRRIPAPHEPEDEAEPPSGRGGALLTHGLEEHSPAGPGTARSTMSETTPEAVVSRRTRPTRPMILEEHEGRHERQRPRATEPVGRACARTRAARQPASTGGEERLASSPSSSQVRNRRRRLMPPPSPHGIRQRLHVDLQLIGRW